MHQWNLSFYQVGGGRGDERRGEVRQSQRQIRNPVHQWNLSFYQVDGRVKGRREEVNGAVTEPKACMYSGASEAVHRRLCSGRQSITRGMTAPYHSDMRVVERVDRASVTCVGGWRNARRGGGCLRY